MLPSAIFFGTPEFAVPALKVTAALCSVKLVISQPDKPSGRGQQLTSPPVKIAAEELGIPVLQPESLRGLRAVQNRLESDDPRSVLLATTLSEIGPVDIAIVVAYGKIIPRPLLAYPRVGCLNIHGSLLPRWRGAAPVHRAIFAGDEESGVCLMRLEEGLDTGPVFSSVSTRIDERDTFLTLHDRLSLLGAELLEKDLSRIISGEKRAEPQPEVGVTYAEKWTKEDCHINWGESAESIERRIRASAPSPGAWTTLNGELVKIHQATVESGVTGRPAGEIVEIAPGALRVAAGQASILTLTEIQFPGKKRLPVLEIQKSRSFEVGSLFL